MTEEIRDARAALHEVDRQRAALAEQVGLPLWYRVLYALAMLGLFIVPALSVLGVRWVIFGPAIQLPAILVLWLFGTVLHRTSGARLATNTYRAYPSARRPMLAVLASILVGSAMVFLLAYTVSWQVSLLAGVLVAALATVGMQRQLDAIRSDIRAGRAVSV